MQGIKYSEVFVINFYKQHGCELLEPYTDANNSLTYRCKCGRISKNNFFFFTQSPHCWDCAVAKQAHNQKFVEDFFRERDCELLDVYKNQSTRMRFRCRCGHISTITFASLRAGCFCQACGGTKKLTTEHVREELSKFGYELLSDYINAKTKLNLTCDKGHDCEISWNNFQRGKRCRVCFVEENWHKPEDRKFVLKCRSLLRNCLRNINKAKTGKTEELLGYTGKQLKEHISKHSDWVTVKDYKWHIDHIFPIKAFIDYKIFDTTVINCLENLRPTTQKINLLKRAKYDKQQFETWLKSKNISF